MDLARKLAIRVAKAGSCRGAARTLLLDLDGTLAPIAPTPGDALVPAPTLDALGRLVRSGWTVAIVSGRQAAEIRRMVPVEGALAFGSHGLEGVWPGGEVSPLDPALRRRLSALARAGRRLVGAHPGTMLERKSAGVAFHHRQLPRRDHAAWSKTLEIWLDQRDLSGLERLQGKCVVEIRPTGVHKGRVADDMPRRRGAPRRDDSLVAIGDDRTDEDLFRAVRGRGLTVRVGRPGEDTAARERLPSPLAVQRFLIRLADYSRAASAAS